MSRGKVATGKAIAFRLPLADDKAFREKAKAEGLSPGQYARKLILWPVCAV
jgi:hypothetical protein